MADTRRVLRKSQTDAELRLWQRLRNRQLGNFKFRRQHPFPPFIVDFVCPEGRLIVEIDGGQHAEDRDADERRTLALQAHGYRVIRFWNNDVLQNMEGVLESILGELRSPPHPPRPHPPPSP